MNKFEFKSQDSNHTTSDITYKEANESLPFYVSHADPDTICFTRKSEFESDLIRTLDWLSIDLDILKNANVLLHLYIHHPGQLIRSFGKPNFETHPKYDLQTYNNRIGYVC